MSYSLIQMLAPINPNGARPGVKISSVEGVTIHMTDNWGKNAGAISHASYLQNGGSTLETSWHYAVDDTYVTQSIPESEISYHCGNYTGNHTTISIEICLNPESDLVVACNNAAQLAASILKRYGLSANSLYRHYDWSGKRCPSQLMDGNPYSWNTFKSKVNGYLGVVNKTFKVGATVKFDGQAHCYASSYGEGRGIIPPKGVYTITHYNPGVMCPIHIGTYGWVPEANCRLI